MPDQSFGAWKEQLRKDCEAHGTLKGYDAMGEEVLKVLWESGVPPKVDAIASETNED